MRNFTLLLILLGLVFCASAQTTFTINNILAPDDEYISDIQFANSRYYALSVNQEAQAPNRYSSTLFIFNDSGQLTNQTQLGGIDFRYFRILSIYHNTVRLIGSIKTDSCNSILTLSEFNINTGILTHLSQYSFCDETFINTIRIVPGLNGKTFFEVIYTIDEFNLGNFFQKTRFMTLDDADNLILITIPGQINWGQLSVDFKGTGYVITNGWIYEYYDSNFNHLSQYNNGGSGYTNDKNSFHQPLVNQYILEQVVNEDDVHSESEIIRLIDNNLRTKKSVSISNVTGYGRIVTLPLNGGIGIAHYNSIWATANFGSIDAETPAYFSITRVDSDMKIICTHFLGFDGPYKIYGITAFEDNGAIVYGWKKYYDVLHGVGDKDIYALKIGNDCELSTTSTNGPTEPLISISAYPNPAANDLTFSINGFDPASLRVELIDESGRILFTSQDLSNGIRVPDLPAGQYFYRILEKDRLLGVGAWVKQ